MGRANLDDERIRRMLAAGDPGAHDASLSPEEQRAMLAELRANASDPRGAGVSPAFARHLGWMRPLFASGTLALVLLLLVSNWPRRESPPVGASAPRRASAPTVATPAPASTAAAIAPGDPRPEEQSAAAQAAHAPVPTAARRLARAAAPRSAPIRMIAKGGTKVVWLLNPNATF